MSNRTQHRLATALLATAATLWFQPLLAQGTETGRDPYAACVAAETARQAGSVTAEARARQKCRKLYPSATVSPPPGRVEATPGVAATSPAGTAPTASPTPPATPSTSAPVATPTPTPTPTPTVPVSTHPHGGPPGLNK